MKKSPLTDRDLKIIETASLFTTFRFKGKGNRDRREFPSLETAREDAGDDPKALIYAVSKTGMTAHVPSDYVSP